MTTFTPDDPRLTAYVLGELEAAERAAVEKLLAGSPDAQAEVAVIQETIGLLKSDFAAEPVPSLTDSQRAAISQHLSRASAVQQSADHSSQGSPNRRVVVAVAGTLAASVAGIALMLPAVQQAREAQWPKGSSRQLALNELQDSRDRQAFAQVDVMDSEPSEVSLSVSESGAPTSRWREEANGVSETRFDAGKYPGAGLGGGAAAGAASEAKKVTEFYGRSTRLAPVNEIANATKPSLSSGAGAGRRVANKQDLAEGMKDAPQREFAEVDSPQSGQRELDRKSAVPGTKAGGFRAVNELAQKMMVTRTAESELAKAGDKASGKSDMKPGATAPTSGLEESKRAKKVGGGLDLLVTAPTKEAAPVAEKPASPTPTPSITFESKAEPKPVLKVASARNRFDEANGSGKSNAPVSEKPAADRPPLLGLNTPQARLSGEVALRGEAEKVSELRTKLRLETTTESLSRDGSKRENIDRTAPAAATPAPTAEAYEAISENEFTTPEQQPLSTFSIDVDSASYANTRRFIRQGQLPPPSAVRVEEFINYFRYDYPQPADGEAFSVTANAAPCPWHKDHYLARVGLKARDIDKTKRPPTNLVFLVDVSGSMQPENKLPLVKRGLLLLTEEMGPSDRISIVTYAGDAGVKLPPTVGSEQTVITQAIEALRAGGSTNGAAGITMAYEQAQRHFNAEGENRVILCTDGDFNVGVSSDSELVQLIQDKAKSGVFLSIFGFGMGNLKDSKLEKLADKGNGHYGYIDDLNEARKVFNEELVGTLYTVAKDVKLQVEFNPQRVGAYRLIGYENRALAAEDFNDDTKDAGEIGAGHTVTALYEIVPVGKWPQTPKVDGLKYAATDKKPATTAKPGLDDADADDLFTVKLRYKQPQAQSSVRTKDLVVDDIAGKKDIAPSRDLMWSACVANFAMRLRHSKHAGNWSLDDLIETLEGTRGDDPTGRRAEFIELVKAVKAQTAPREN